MPKRVLVTGAAGRIGTALTTFMEEEHRGDVDLILTDLEPRDRGCTQLDVTDYESCVKAMSNTDIVIHLAGIVSTDAPFEDLLPVNIVGTYNVFRAAAETATKRIIYASSAQAIEAYPVDFQVRVDDPPRPRNLYGVSKAFGESLGAYYAFETGIEVIAIRIGAFEYPEEWSRMGARDLSAWIHPHDLCRLIECCIDAQLGRRRFAIVHGVSNNRYKRLDLSDTMEMTGYAPRSDAFATWHIGLSEESRPR